MFCRVRPVGGHEASSGDHDSTLAVEFPAQTDLLSAELQLQVRGGRGSCGEREREQGEGGGSSCRVRYG